MNNAPNKWQKEETLRRRLYLVAKRKGLALQLCRKQGDDNPDRNTFRILNRTSGAVIHSVGPGGYGLTLDQVEQYLADHPAKEQAATLHAIIQRKTAGDIQAIQTFMKPYGKAGGSHHADLTDPDTSITPRDPHTLTLPKRNLALLEALARNPQEGIERDTSQLRVCQQMLLKMKSER